MKRLYRAGWIWEGGVESLRLPLSSLRLCSV